MLNLLKKAVVSIALLTAVEASTDTCASESLKNCSSPAPLSEPVMEKLYTDLARHHWLEIKEDIKDYVQNENIESFKKVVNFLYGKLADSLNQSLKDVIIDVKENVIETVINKVCSSIQDIWRFQGVMNRNPDKISDMTTCALWEDYKPQGIKVSINDLNEHKNELDSFFSSSPKARLILDCQNETILGKTMSDAIIALSHLKHLVIIGNAVRAIDDNFLYCSRLSSVDLSGLNIQTIGNNVLSGSISLADIELPSNNITRIGAFFASGSIAVGAEM